MTTSNLSFVRYTGDGVQTQFSLVSSGKNMGYFRTSDIHSYVDGVEVPNTIQIQSPHIVTITPAPVVGSDILIRREMPNDKPYSDFARGNNFGHRQVNNTFLQQLYLLQELLDGFTPEGYYLKQDLNAGGNSIVNVKPTETDDGLVTRGQADKRYLNSSGDSLEGTLDMDGNILTGLRTASGLSDAISLGQADSKYLHADLAVLRQNLNAGGFRIVNLHDAIGAQDALPLLQASKVVDDKLTEYDENGYRDYGLVTDEISDELDYGGI